MYRFERALKEERHLGEMKSNSPSFSSTLLDEIYRSIDGCEPKRDPGRRLLHWEAPSKKQGTRGSAQVTPQPASFAEKRGSDGADPTAAGARRGHFSQELLRKPKHEPDLDSDGLYFSSTSISSDSSSGGFSFSDTESVRGAKTTTSSSCFAPFRLKPVRTRVAARGDERQRAPFGERREGQEDQGGALRSAASRIYANLKKVKQQPVSPGGRLVSFINSIFSTTPKSANRSDPAEANRERKLKSGQSSSSASVFSTVSSPTRPCLSKRSPSTRERFRSGAKRTVRFYPVSVIVDEDCRPCGHKSLHQEGGGGEKQSSSVSLTVPKVWRIGKSQPRKIDQDRSLNLKDLLMEKSRRLEENARELLRDYRENQRKGFELKGHCEKEVGEEEDDDDDDGGASCSSSDLFELDHLAAINDKYSEELPVYETTYFDKCRVSGKGYRL